ncbi:BspA family leucine-rich repeat surface protein [Candidatus Saccharibacteria bacterium oral taxon 955]|nr:BspA family leucine-rich repeat surface protein [Candidatus Saccharibacteria bacterium oral taxon 955]
MNGKIWSTRLMGGKPRCKGYRQATHGPGCQPGLYVSRRQKSKGEGADWQWDTKNVESLNSTFSGARQFNQNISSWNTSKVTDMDNTFTNAYEFNQPIQSWDVSKSILWCGVGICKKV